MHGPYGTDYENTTKYLEAEPQARLVYDHGGHRDRPPLFRMTALFAEQDGRTRLDLSLAFATPEVAMEMRGFIRKAGGESTWDRLAEHVGKRRTGQETFVINRSFLTLADCAAAPSLFYADWAHEIPAALVNLRTYRTRLLNHPSVARCVDEARPYRSYFPLWAPDCD